MGQLVFQAALGGTTSLVGPNTASTNSLTIPNASGYMAWSTSALTSGRVTYAGTGGLLQDNANLTFDGSTLTTLNIAYTGTFTGGTGVVNLGSGQFYKDASGNVLIGKTAAYRGGKLVVASANATQTSTTANLQITTTDTQAADVGGSIGLGGQVGGDETPFGYISGRKENSTSANYAGYLAFATQNAAGGVTERMRIDSSGNVIIGTTAIGFAEKFRVYGTYSVFDNGTYTGFIGAGNSLGTGTSTDFAFRSSNAMAFLTGGATERMRIDSSGNVCIATTGLSTVSRLSLKYAGAGSQYGFGLQPVADTTTAIFFNNAAGTQVGSISQTASVTTYNVTSDYRLKENVTPMTSVLDTIAKLKPVNYTWKESGENGQGFIAHELQEVVPDCVTGEKDAMRIETYEISPAIPAEVDEDGKIIKEAVEAVMGEKEVPAYQGIDTSFLIATLVKAIQELNAKVTTLESK